MKNVLILSSNNGQGHNSAAAALCEEFSERRINCQVKDALSFGGEKLSAEVAEFHNSIAKNNRREIFIVGNWIASHQIGMKMLYRENASFAQKAHQFILSNQYDAVIATHVFPAMTLTHIKRRFNASLQTFFVDTDYSCHAAIRETALDGYFIPHASLADHFVACDIQRMAIHSVGIPIHKSFRQITAKESARETLDLPPENKIILIMSGSMGAGDILKMVRQIAMRFPQVTTVALCGNNHILKEKIDALSLENRHICAYSYTHQVPLFMDAADIIITKPGGLSISEAAAKQTPLLLSRPLPGWEQDNVDFFVRRKMALYGNNVRYILEKIETILNSSEIQQELIQNQKSHCSANAAEKIVDTLLQITSG